MFIFIHCYIEGILSGCDKQLFLIIFAVKGEQFCSFQDFQGPQSKFKDFPGPGIFFCQFHDFPGFSRTVQPRQIDRQTNRQTYIHKYIHINRQTGKNKLAYVVNGLSNSKKYELTILTRFLRG